MWDGRLQGVKAIVQRQQRVPAEGDDDRLLLNRQNRGLWLLRTGRQVGHTLPPAPLRHRLLVDPVAFCQEL